KRFQYENGLESDGWAGPQTLDAIGRKLAERKLQPKVEAAEQKVDAAKKVVEDAAGSGKVSTTEWLTGIVGAGGTLSVIKQAIDSVTEATRSFGDMLSTLGPWLLLGIVVVGGA